MTSLDDLVVALAALPPDELNKVKREMAGYFKWYNASLPEAVRSKIGSHKITQHEWHTVTNRVTARQHYEKKKALKAEADAKAEARKTYMREYMRGRRSADNAEAD